MSPPINHRDPSGSLIYLSFDQFPGPKGAATHIDAFNRWLGGFAQSLGREAHLVTLPPGPEAIQQGLSPWSATGITHHSLPASGEHLFDRVASFRRHLWHWWRQRFGQKGLKADTVHFRSIFEGYPIARDKNEYCRKLIYEVNGLPSLELKYHYPRVADDRDLMQKLTFQEQVCLDAADMVITVSDVNRDHLLSRGVPPERITLIRNGVDTTTFSPGEPLRDWSCPPDDDHPLRLLYVGTMTSWQGLGYAIEALARLRRDAPARLQVVGPGRRRQRSQIQTQAFKAKVGQHIEFHEPVTKPRLAEFYAQADIALAPLTACDRNLVQGCSPLKVLEAHASGIPLIASDLPVVRELATHDEDAVLVRPNSAKAIKDAALRFLAEPTLAARLREQGRRRVEQAAGWTDGTTSLESVYQHVLSQID